jgi:hypothetical protein
MGARRFCNGDTVSPVGTSTNRLDGRMVAQLSGRGSGLEVGSGLAGGGGPHAGMRWVMVGSSNPLGLAGVKRKWSLG